jgi:hypothetical protein
LDLGILNNPKEYLHYSNFKESLIEHLSDSIKELAKTLSIPLSDFDYSLKSLDLISQRAILYGIENNEEKLFDGLVAYIGELIRKDIGGEWRIWGQVNMPSIFINLSWFDKHNWIFPVNIVWGAFYDPANFPLRKLVRNNLARIKMVKGLQQDQCVNNKAKP